MLGQILRRLRLWKGWQIFHFEKYWKLWIALPFFAEFLHENAHHLWGHSFNAQGRHGRKGGVIKMCEDAWMGEVGGSRLSISGYLRLQLDRLSRSTVPTALKYCFAEKWSCLKPRFSLKARRRLKIEWSLNTHFYCLPPGRQLTKDLCSSFSSLKTIWSALLFGQLAAAIKRRKKEACKHYKSFVKSTVNFLL